ncbi:MAG: acyl CoA:acetate/3-ketoacid CoA transferase [Clostridiales Family XIII bacterium]|jgi:propionate CoA-transferase|nr:acyl CoA:acetate/3-ketoacid CoA transferase [Clostridiales Family XIII bacterium]
MAKFITAREAAKLIPDGATVGLCGDGLNGWPEEIALEIAANFQEQGHPRALNLKQGSALGDWKERGVTRLGLPGLVSKWTAAHVGNAFALNELALANKIACHWLPLGVALGLWREIAAGREGLMTKVGLGTFVDPRLGGGKMTDITKEEIVELREMNGEEFLFFKGFPVDVALIRGTSADANGNISMEKDGFVNEGLELAMAAHNTGGIVVVQVERLAAAGTLYAKSVRIPGILVDYVVEATKPEACWQTGGKFYEPSFSGEIIRPLETLPPLALDERKCIARRCALELRPGNIVNLGVGVPTDVASVIAEEGLADQIVLTSETGTVGGVPAPLPNFGNAYNPWALIENISMFDFIDGGGLDVTCLGLAQADAEGNINVSKFGKRLFGPGGFINITKKTKRIIFAGTFMNKAEVAVRDGRVTVLKEGTQKKFVGHVEQITFAGQYADPGQTVLYVTERCVFRLIGGKMTLVEIAPGIDLQRDILSQMDFLPAVSKELKLMEEGIFHEEWHEQWRGSCEEIA